MSKLLVLGVLLFSTFSAHSFATAPVANPQIRACNTVGGQFTVINYGYDQIGLCLLGFSIVGAIDILNKDGAIEIPLSLYNYRKGVMTCSSENVTRLTTTQGNPFYVCLYSDGSLIDLETLTAGKASLRNVDLNRALAIKL